MIYLLGFIVFSFIFALILARSIKIADHQDAMYLIQLTRDVEITHREP